MQNTLSAPSVPTQTIGTEKTSRKDSPWSDRWESIGIDYKGFPVYVNKMDGTMAYEADYERLVSVPEEVEERIVDIKMMDFELQSLPEECRAALARRAN